MYQQCSLHAPSRVYIEFVETMSGLRNHSFASGGLLNPGRTLFYEYLYKGWTNYQRNCCYVCTSKPTQISVVNDSQLITQEEMYCSLPTELYNFWVCYQSVVGQTMTKQNARTIPRYSKGNRHSFRCPFELQHLDCSFADSWIVANSIGNRWITFLYQFMAKLCCFR